jgi:acetylornithine deacetylase/succinyl-diaminopimelate desuccinylase-like protein
VLAQWNDELECTRERLVRDVAALTGFDRRATGRGEADSARRIARRLQQIGADDVRVSTFRSQSSWGPAHLTHLAVGIAAAALPGPIARVAGAAVAGSYEMEVSGRNQWVRRFLPAGQGTSVAARIPAAATPRRTVVLVAHHDGAHTGLVWHPATVAGSRYLARRTGYAMPSHLPALTAMAASAVPSRWGRAFAVVVLTATAALTLQSMRSPTTPGANDNASGVAVVLELARRFIRKPLPHTELLLVFPGAEEVGNTGIRAWLRARRPALEPESTLVINLDAVGSSGHLAVAQREGLTSRLGEQDVSMALNAAAELGITLQPIGIPNTTDGAVLKRSGLPTISLLSSADGWISHLHRDSDCIENVDWRTVEDAVCLTEHLAVRWNEDAR